MGLIGPEVDDAKVLDIPIDQAEILVTNKDIIGKPLKDFRTSDAAGQFQITKIERAGNPIPAGLETKLERMDVVFVTGLKGTVQKVGDMVGRIARPSTATDILTLAIGMILGLCIGLIQFPAFGSNVGLGNAGGLLVAGVIVSSLQSRLRFFGNTPNAARNILEDLGLIVFVCIVGINSGNSLLTQLTGAIAIKIFVVGFIACSDPADHRVGDRLPLLQDQPGGADGWGGGSAQPLGPVPGGGGRDQQFGAVDRLPGGLRGLGGAAHRGRLLRDGAGQVIQPLA